MLGLRAWSIAFKVPLCSKSAKLAIKLERVPRTLWARSSMVFLGALQGGWRGGKYSKSMIRAGDDGLVWSAETLDGFLENPKSLVAKTRMSFRGLRDRQKIGQI